MKSRPKNLSSGEIRSWKNSLARNASVGSTEIILAPKISISEPAVRDINVLLAFDARPGNALIPLVSYSESSIKTSKPLREELVLLVSVYVLVDTPVLSGCIVISLTSSVFTLTISLNDRNKMLLVRFRLKKTNSGPRVSMR